MLNIFEIKGTASHVHIQKRDGGLEACLVFAKLN